MFIALIMVALFALANNHLGHSLGDRIFTIFGVSPWTGQERTGLHLPVVLGLILLAVGVAGTLRVYRDKYPKMGRWIFLGGIAFFLIYPVATEKTMFIFKFYATGVSSLDYAQKESQCSLQSEGKQVKANCSFTIYNYGQVEEITLKPLFSDHFADIEFEPSAISLQPHRKMKMNKEFYGKLIEDTGFSGFMQDFAAEVEVNGTKRRFE
ncbi:hypothetical protein [Paenibacillus macerans]|uniref:hypothetical protein n=1 Tax=Paenibacillus macerans TaxID=44252 RepID=UPI003D3102A3